jgi:hypothetical protein
MKSLPLKGKVARSAVAKRNTHWVMDEVFFDKLPPHQSAGQTASLLLHPKGARRSLNIPDIYQLWMISIWDFVNTSDDFPF